MLSKAFQELNHAAAVVYINMMMEAGPKPTFEMPRHKYEKFISRGGFKKAVAELVARGFIEIEENNAHRKKPNVYRFADGWKNWPGMTTCADAGDGTAKLGK